MRLLNTSRLPCRVAVLLTSFLAPLTTANAQESYIAPPVVRLLDANSVNLVAGSVQFQLKEGAVGAPDNELDYTEYWQPTGRESSWASWLIRYQDDNDLRTYVTLNLGGSSVVFSRGLYESSYPTTTGYGTLTESSDGRTFTYVDRIGVAMVFALPAGALSSAFCLVNSSASGAQCALPLATVTKPNGVIFTNTWNVVNYYARLSSTENNLGFRSVRNYAYNGTNISGNLVSWLNPSSVDFFNLAQSSSPIATISRSISGTSETVTTVGGKTWQVRTPTASGVSAIRRPGAASDSPTYTYGNSSYPQRVTAVTDNGQTTNYNFSESGATGTMTVTDANGGVSVISLKEFNNKVSRSAFPTQIVDELGRSTTYASTGAYWITEITRPDGDKDIISYDSRKNIISKTVRAKPSQSAPDIVTSAVFPSSCDNFLTCNKPTSTTDALGSVNDYTYDPQHGGVLTATGPAVNGVRPQTRYTYSQHYAWVMNGSGGYARSSSPVWLLDKQSYCKITAASGAGCAGGSSDEVQTLYDYGPDSGPNNLFLRGIVEITNGVSLRTCFGYDPQGNKISKTSPRAGLTSCQ